MTEPDLFPENFLWGAATSAYQVEGSPLADGAGPSIWHRFAHTPGRVHAGQNGDVACDHYRRFEEDVEWMSRLGLSAYRFSLSWSRLLPQGTGRLNEAGLAFYSRLVDRLLERGITPLATLYHWDLPAALDDQGGWLNPESPQWFAEYAALAWRALGDRVKLWATLNEPWVSVDAGYLHGTHAPGHRSVAETPVAAHHLLQAHAAAVRAFRRDPPPGGRIGIVVNLVPREPASDSPEDREAARRADAYLNRQFLDPLFFGRSPKELPEMFGREWPSFPVAEVRALAEPVDFVGVNYYLREIFRDDPAAAPVRAREVRVPGRPRTDTGWEIWPEGLTRTLTWVRERYGDLPLYVTENGAAFPEPEHFPGEVLEDPRRVEDLRDHLAAAREAIRRGVDLRGYFAWSLLDNFEWAEGYSKRFGLLHVDFDTQKRTAKRSALYYRDVIRARGGILPAR